MRTWLIGSLTITATIVIAIFTIIMAGLFIKYYVPEALLKPLLMGTFILAVPCAVFGSDVGEWVESKFGKSRY